MESAIVVDVERIQAQINHVQNALTDQPSKNTIYRVPAHICRGREDLFRPHMVSIGPYHRGRAELQKMEQIKCQFLMELIEKPGFDATRYINKLRDLEGSARACYFDLVSLDYHQFINMMLLDGCFIVLFLIKWHISMRRDPTEIRYAFNSRDTKLRDACGNSWWSLGSISHDLFLLENQIPFFVLQELFELISPLYFTRQMDLQQMVFQFLVEPCTSLSTSKQPATSRRPHHLLHLCYLRYTKREDAATGENNSIRSKEIYSAINLVHAGVTFRKREDADTFFDIDFKNGILKIPFISMEEETMHRLANLVALEQCDADVGGDITTYAVIMDCLIDTSDDVEILRRRKILGKIMASNKEIADFFNQLGAYSIISTHNNRLTKVFVDVDEYCKSRWHENRARLMQDYFSSPWTSISVVVALMILLYTASQSFMAFYSYAGFHHRKATIIFSLITAIPPALLIIFILIKSIK